MGPGFQQAIRLFKQKACGTIDYPILFRKRQDVGIARAVGEFLEERIQRRSRFILVV